jgi:hypothetical protein
MQKTNLTFLRCVNSDDPGHDLANLNVPVPASPEPESIKAEQRRKMATATAAQARVLMPGRIAPACDSPSPVEAIRPKAEPPVRCCPKCGRPLPANTPAPLTTNENTNKRHFAG